MILAHVVNEFAQKFTSCFQGTMRGGVIGYSKTTQQKQK